MAKLVCVPREKELEPTTGVDPKSTATPPLSKRIFTSVADSLSIHLTVPLLLVMPEAYGCARRRKAGSIPIQTASNRDLRFFMNQILRPLGIFQTASPF